jgi:hypothetical protein
LGALILFCKIRPTCKTDEIQIEINELKDGCLTIEKFEHIRKISLIKYNIFKYTLMY